MTAFFLKLVALVFLAGCQTQKDHHGFIIEDKNFQKLKLGQTQSSVLTVLGPPTFDLEPIWYYVSCERQQRALSHPWIVPEKTKSYGLVWDNKGMLKQVIRGDKGCAMNYDPQTTSVTEIKKSQWFKDMFQNTSSIPGVNLTL